jgi:hypothetical protein
MTIIFVILLVLVVTYLLEVILGSSSSVHDAEIGLCPRPFVKERTTSKKFLHKLAPLILVSLGLPLMFESLFLGIVCLAASLLLIVWHLH